MSARGALQKSQASAEAVVEAAFIMLGGWYIRHFRKNGVHAVRIDARDLFGRSICRDIDPTGTLEFAFGFDVLPGYALTPPPWREVRKVWDSRHKDLL